MIRYAPILAAILALSACSPPTSEHANSSAASKVATDDRTLEAQAMAAHPGYARRDGGVLTLILNGKDAVRLSDGSQGCGAMDDCPGWTFRGVEHLQSTTGLDPYALVAHDAGGERTRYTFIGTDPGLTWFDGWPAVSPTGQYIVSANPGGSLVLVDWSTPYPHTTYDFGSDCTFMSWTSDREAQARCTYPGGKATTATLALYNQVWRLSDDQEIDADAADIQPVEGSKLKKRVAIVKGQPGQAASETDLKAEGFERLP